MNFCPLLPLLHDRSGWKSVQKNKRWMSLNIWDFSENRCSYSHTSRVGVNEILLVFSDRTAHIYPILSGFRSTLIKICVLKFSSLCSKCFWGICTLWNWHYFRAMVFTIYWRERDVIYIYTHTHISNYMFVVLLCAWFPWVLTRTQLH